MGKKEKEAEEACAIEPEYEVSYFRLFRFGTACEILATFLGVILGILSGSGVCFNLLQFGEMSTSMVERTVFAARESSYMPITTAFGGGRILNNATHAENMAALLEDAVAMTIGMLVSFCIMMLLCFVSIALINWSAIQQVTRIRAMFFRAVMRQDMSWYDTDSEFNLASRMSDDMMKLREGLGEKLGIVSNLLGTAIFGICVALPLGWELSLACMTVVPFSIASSIVLSNYQMRSSIHELDSYSQAGKQAEEVLKSVRTVVAFAGEQKEVDRYGSLLAPAERYGRKRGLFSGIGTGLNWILTYSLNAIGLAYGTRLVLRDYLKPAEERDYLVGDLFSILFNIFMATQSITFCVPHGEAFSAAKAAGAGIFRLIDRMPGIDSLASGGLAPRRVKGEIELDDVTFSYPSRPDIKVLKGFSLSIRPGETVALVGSSGCGKTTILQLIQRLYDPHYGSVKLDSKDVRDLNLGWLRSSLGVVGQEPVLFRGTIHDNIAIGVPEATRHDVQRVAEMAYAHDFVVNLPNGYDTVIGERGASLSGGQKQRVAIARSLLREPAVLLLDEATSALDPHSERQVQAALDRAAEGRTTLVVSHRLSSIVNADRIVCMDQGAIVEEGTHEELLKIKGFYWKLVNAGGSAKEADVIDTVVEEPGGDEVLARAEPKRRSARKIHRKHSTRQVSSDSSDWMAPRGSISSVMSTGLKNYIVNAESDGEPEDEDQDEKVKPVSDWQLLKLNAPEWPLILVGCVAAFIQGACFPAFAFMFGYAIGIFSYEDESEIIRQSILYSILFVVIAGIAGVAMCLQSTTFTNAGLKMTSRLRKQYFSSLLRQEIGYFDKESNSVGALCARLSGDTAMVQGATGLRIGLVLQGVSSVVVGFLMAVSFNWKLTLVGTAFLPLMLGSIWLEGTVSQKSQTMERNALESATAIATEAIISIRTVQSLGVEQIFLDKFDASIASAVSAIFRKTRWRGLVLAMGVYIPMLAYMSATVYGITLVANEDLPYKVVILVNEATMYGAYMLGQSLVYAPNFNSAKACGARILATINRVPKVQTEPGVHDKKRWVASGSINFKDLEFSYPTRMHLRILKGIDLKVEAGKMIALVGSSGCGKSTVLQLLQRFYDPDSGSIELDGVDTRSGLTLPRLRQQLGVVQQEPVLFDRSIAENIAYGDTSRRVTLHEVVAAAKAANIHSFIVSLPQGYETSLGAGGAQLSGGQKQRVCIARALVRSPRLLLLDEATSALDANSEKAVSEALEKAAKGRTCISIAHRLSTIKDADLICVLNKGRIAERGTHAELVALRGHYYRMSLGQQLA